MTADRLLAVARAEKPHVRYAKSRDEQFIGGWSEQHNRFVPVAGRRPDGEWGTIYFELLIDGRPLNIQWVS